MSLYERGGIESHCVFFSYDVQAKKNYINELIQMTVILSYNAYIFDLFDFSHDDFVRAFDNSLTIIVFYLLLELLDQACYFLLNGSFYLLVKAFLQQSACLIVIEYLALLIFNPADGGREIQCQIFFVVEMIELKYIRDIFFIAYFGVFCLLGYCFRILAL